MSKLFVIKCVRNDGTYNPEDYSKCPKVCHCLKMEKEFEENWICDSCAPLMCINDCGEYVGVEDEYCSSCYDAYCESRHSSSEADSEWLASAGFGTDEDYGG